jgi:oligopeptide transport system substrate-binding protein
VLKKLSCLLLVTVIIAGILTGCQGNTPPETTEQRLVYAMASEPPIMDPGLNYYLSPSNVLQNLFRGLYKLDVEGNVVPCIATDCEIDETGTVYTFNLRTDTKWSDGEPLDAYDFEYSWKRILDPEVGASTSYALDSIKNAKKCAAGELPLDEVGIKAIDEKTFQVTLEAPTAWFLFLTTTPNFMPVRQDVAEIEGWANNADTYICNGPFMITEMLPQEKYVLKKNPHYYDADKVKLETIEIVFMESAESTMIAYNNGEVHFTENVSPEAKQKYFGTDEYIASPKIGITFFDFNCVKEPFDDVRVRKAFSMAINRQDILDYVLESPEKPAYSYVPTAYYNPAKPEQEFRDVIDNNLFSEDISLAQQLLAEAGYPGGEGMPKIELVVGTSQAAKDLAQAMQEMWKTNLGVTVEIVTYDSKTGSEMADLGNFHIISDGWTGLYPDPISIMQPMDWDSGSVINTFWSNKEFHDLLAGTIAETDQQKRMDDFVRMEQIIIDEMPIIPLYFHYNTYLCKPNMKNVIKNLIGHTYLEYAYVE